MAPKGAAYHTDWVYSNCSNVHVANHKDWFIKFTSFTSKTGTVYFGPDSGFEVLGVGDVELTVKTHHSRSGRKKIVLRDVLYCPDSFCNILGQGIINDYNIVHKQNPNGTMRMKLVEKSNGANVGILDAPRLTRLRLIRYRPDQTSLKEDVYYLVNAVWPTTERARWMRQKTASFESDLSGHLPPLSDAEKSWLKKHWGNEFKFLQAHGLHIAKDEQREEGRLILKAMIANEPEW